MIAWSTTGPARILTLAGTRPRRTAGRTGHAPACLLLACILLLGACTAPARARADPPFATRAPAASTVVLQGLTLVDAPAFEAARQRFEALPTPRAQAIAVDSDGRWAAGESAARTHELAAVASAIDACAQARVLANVNARCEVLRLGDETFELGLATRLRTRADDPATPAVLWRFRRGDAVLYIAGSMHAQRTTVLPLAPSLEAAYTRADTLLVEVDMATVSDAEMLDVARTESLLPAGQTLDDVLSPVQHRAMQDSAARLGVPWTQLAPMRPGSALAVMSVAAMTTAGLEADNGVESLLLQRARRDRKAIVGIERYADQVALLADAPTDDGVAANTDEGAAAALAPATMRAGIIALFDAWMRADDAAILQAFNGEDGSAPDTPGADAARAWTRRLLDARNVHMADRAAQQLHTGAGTALMVVGAGHLPGPRGVIALLAAAGFEGSQLTRGGADYRAAGAPSAALPAVGTSP